MSKDYYSILGVEKNASKEDMKKAFHKLAHKFHPDKKGGDSEKFKEINEAYQVLSDDKKRAQFDQFGSAYASAGGGPASGWGDSGQGFGDFGQGFGFDFSSAQQGGFSDFGDIGEIFSEFFTGGGGRTQVRRGRDIATEIQIPFAEAIFGTERALLITKTSLCETCHGSGAMPGAGMKKCGTCNGQGKIHEIKKSFFGNFSNVRTCETCHGSGEVPKEACLNCKGNGVLKKEQEIKVIIPAGINDGEMIRMQGAGEAVPKGTPGDLYIKISVQPHSLFRREGSNLTMDLDLKLSDALLGGERVIQTLDGEVKVEIPEGVSPGEILRVRGKGVPSSKLKRGDLLIKVNLKLPNKLSRYAKDLIEKLKEEGI